MADTVNGNRVELGMYRAPIWVVVRCASIPVRRLRPVRYGDSRFCEENFDSWANGLFWCAMLRYARGLFSLVFVCSS